MTTRRVVLVTGAAGFVGVPTCQRLLESGFDVVGTDNFASVPIARLGALAGRPRFRFLFMDLRRAGAVRKLLAETRPWGVIHLAALHFIPYCEAHPDETLAVNVLGLQHLLDAIDGLDVVRLLFTSTGDVYRPSESAHMETDATEPINLYGASKLMGEWLIRFWQARSTATSTVIVRLFNVYGPGETNPHVLSDICSALKKGDVLRLGNMTSRRDYVYVDDVARTLVSLLTSTPGDVTVNLGTGTTSSVAELVHQVRNLTGRPVTTEIDHERLRKVDRVSLQADVNLLRSLVPDDGITTRLDGGLAALLRAEGLL